jgi:hypothetical protein
MIQRRGAATFQPIINTNEVLGNDTIQDESHVYNQFKSQGTNCY